jgi:hypothetical protein
MAEGVEPAALTLALQRGAAALPAQMAEFGWCQGNHRALAPTEQGLGTLEPQPAGGALGRAVALADQGGKLAKIQSRGSGIGPLLQQLPGGGDLAPGR